MYAILDPVLRDLKLKKEVFGQMEEWEPTGDHLQVPLAKLELEL